jgi:Leucine-rich repeat (LRR) protein
MKTLTKVALHCCGVYGSNLVSSNELQHLNLLELDISNQGIKDISPLRHFANMRKLNIINNQIDDISVISNFKHLQFFYATSNLIHDLSPLKELHHLKEIQLSDNKVSDLSALENLTELEVFLAWENKIKDISPLKKATKLSKGYFYDNPITTLPDWIANLAAPVQCSSTAKEGITFGFGIKNPPSRIINQGKEAIRQYFLEQQEE